MSGALKNVFRFLYVCVYAMIKIVSRKCSRPNYLQVLMSAQKLRLLSSSYSSFIVIMQLVLLDRKTVTKQALHHPTILVTLFLADVLALPVVVVVAVALDDLLTQALL